jgi:Flavoprotein involved in thiazole biosynthesis
MSTNDNERKGIDRRTFLKGAAAVGAVAAVSAALPAKASAEGAPDAVSGATSREEAMKQGTISSDWLGKAPEIADADIKKTVDADVVVVGGGYAGLMAAWYAAKGGAKVSVIESQAEDKYSFFAEQIGHFNSQYLIKQGFGPYDEGEIVAEFCKCCGNRINPILIQKFVHNSGRMFDSYYDMVPKGSRFLQALNVHQASSAYGKPKYPIERSGYKTWAGCAQFRGDIFEKPIMGVAANSQLPGINKTLIKPDAEKHGATWYFGQEATVLAMSGDAVVGCIAKGAEGYTKFIGKKAVILATGDFAGNADMCNALITEIAEEAEMRGQAPASICGWGRKGQGHKMGIWAGGYLEESPHASMTMGGAGGPFGMTPFLVLNCKGERFMNEDVAIGQPPLINRQPLGTVCAIMDKDWLKIVQHDSVNHGNPDFGQSAFIAQAVEDMKHVLAAGKDGYDVRSMAITERMGSKVYGANTLPELADILGYKGKEKETFLASVAHYNELCAKGVDSDFGKQKDVMISVKNGPFYATKGDNLRVSVGLVTLSGLVTDNDFNVLNKKGAGIKGLYAVGNCLGRRYANAYATPVAGNSIGMAMTHGMLAGELAAKL